MNGLGLFAATVAGAALIAAVAASPGVTRAPVAEVPMPRPLFNADAHRLKEKQRLQARDNVIVNAPIQSYVLDEMRKWGITDVHTS